MSTSEHPYHFEAAAGYSVVTLHPLLNDSQWADIERVGNEVCEKYISSGAKSVLVDLSELNYMGSAMVALIVRLWKSVKEKNGKMVVVNNDEMVYEVLKLAGLHKVWTIVESREEGFAKLGISARSTGSSSGGGNGLLITGVLTLVGSIAGLLMVIQSVGDPKTALMINVVCSLVSLVVGMMLCMKFTDFRQKMGIGIAGVGIIALLAGIMLNPKPQTTQAKEEAKPEVTKVEPTQPEVIIDTTKAESTKAEETKKEPTKAESTKAEETKKEPAKAKTKEDSKPTINLDEKK